MVVDHVSCFRLQVPAIQVKADLGASTISVFHLLSALREYNSTFGAGDSFGSLDISTHSNGVISNLLKGVYPPHTIITLCTFRVPSFSSLGQLKCDPMSGFRGGIDGQDNVISIGSSLRSNSTVSYFESIWAPHGIDLDTHFILAFSIETIAPPSVPSISTLPLPQLSPSPNIQHPPSLTAPPSPLSSVQPHHASIGLFSEAPFPHSLPPVGDQRPFQETVDSIHGQLRITPWSDYAQSNIYESLATVVPTAAEQSMPSGLPKPCARSSSAHIESYASVVALLHPTDPAKYDRIFKLAVYTRNTNLFLSAQSLLSMNSIVEKLGNELGQSVPTAEVVPHFNWSPTTYRNKLHLFMWAYRAARSSKWNDSDRGRNDQYCLDHAKIF